MKLFNDLMEKLLRNKLSEGKFLEVDPARSKMMSAIKGRGNKSTERNFRLALVRAKISGWKLNLKIVGNPDICFYNEKVVVFLDGCFWHGCPKCGHIPKKNFLYWETKILRNKERDSEKALKLEEQGYKVIRFWEHELIENMPACVSKLKKLLREC